MVFFFGVIGRCGVGKGIPFPYIDLKSPPGFRYFSENFLSVKAFGPILDSMDALQDGRRNPNLGA